MRRGSRFSTIYPTRIKIKIDTVLRNRSFYYYGWSSYRKIPSIYIYIYLYASCSSVSRGSRGVCTAALRRLYADICTSVHVHVVLVRVICSFVNLWLRKREFRVVSRGEESRFAENQWQDVWPYVDRTWRCIRVLRGNILSVSRYHVPRVHFFKD